MSSFSFHRRLGFEPLEDRRLLASFTVTNLNDLPVAMSGDAPGTLRQAIFDANNLPGVDTIEFDSALTSGGPATINLSSLGDLVISTSMSINGPGANRLTINAYDPTPTLNNRDGSRVFRLEDGDIGTFIDVELHGLTLTGADPGGSGGAIVSGDNLTIADSVITGNYSIGHGGAIYHFFGALNIERSTISNNSVSYLGLSRQGGGIFARYGSVTLTDSTISGNSASGHGGAIYQEFGNLNVVRSTLSNNWTANTGPLSHGGAIFSRHGNLTVSESTISGNLAVGHGGGIYLSNGNLSILGSTISGNSAPRTSTQGNNYLSGGGIHIESADGQSALISNTTISGNYARGAAGAIRFISTGGTPALWRIEHSTIVNNQAGFAGSITTAGGAIRVDGPDVTIDHSIVAQNTDVGGGYEDLAGESFVIRHSVIGMNAGSRYAASPYVADANGNLIGPIPSSNSLLIFVQLAAMGQFGSILGIDEGLRKFEYSLNGAPFAPLFTTWVDYGANQSYLMDSGQVVTHNFPLTVGGQHLDDFFSAVGLAIPSGGEVVQSVAIRFVAYSQFDTNAFAWRNLSIYDFSDTENAIGIVAAAEGHGDFYSTVTTDQDFLTPNQMFGIRSRLNPGAAGIPASMLDNSLSIEPSDMQGIIGQLDNGRFFGDVATDSTRSATWTFIHPGLPLDPKLGPLTNNGGPTATHALAPDSPALDAGNQAFVFNPAGYDQRGASYLRVFDGDGLGGPRIDIGAFELQPPPPALPGDYNLDGSTDAADYVMWRKLNGSSVSAPYDGADGSGNMSVGTDDHGVWSVHFGETAEQGAGSGEQGVVGEAAASLESTESLPSTLNSQPPTSRLSKLQISEFELQADQIPSRRIVRFDGPPLTSRPSSANDDAILAWLSGREASSSLGIERPSLIDDDAPAADDDDWETEAVEAVFDELRLCVAPR